MARRPPEKVSPPPKSSEADMAGKCWEHQNKGNLKVFSFLKQSQFLLVCHLCLLRDIEGLILSMIQIMHPPTIYNSPLDGGRFSRRTACSRGFPTMIWWLVCTCFIETYHSRHSTLTTLRSRAFFSVEPWARALEGAVRSSASAQSPPGPHMKVWRQNMQNTRTLEVQKHQKHNIFPH